MNEHAIEQHVGRAEPADEHHPQAGTYIVVAIILTILTAFEIGVFYAPFLQSILVPLLVILAILKFILVAGFYMHLHFDSWVFLTLFVFPLALATLIVMSLMLLFFYLGEHLAL